MLIWACITFLSLYINDVYNSNSYSNINYYRITYILINITHVCSPNIRQLSSSWNSVNDLATQVFAKLKDFCDTRQNYVSFRTRMNRLKSAVCVPPATILLGDCFNADELSSNSFFGLINWKKYCNLCDTISECTRFQKGRFRFTIYIFKELVQMPLTS